MTSYVALLPTAFAALLYLVLNAIYARALLRARRRTPVVASRAPRVTIFKPLAGNDDELEENLESFAALDYPSFEILFGVASTRDPAAHQARQFLARHPELDARLIVTDRDAAINPKVAQLIGMDRHATGEVVVISDSNVRVSARYLWRLVSELEDPDVGIVTSILAGTGERSLGAALENLQLATVVTPGIIIGASLTSRPPTVGKSMAMRRRDLVILGGFRRLSAVLAEDHVVGRLFLDAGFSVRTSLEAVENRNVDCSLWRTLERHTRWAKMRRSLVPLAFFAEPLAAPLAVASLMVALAPSRATVAVAVIAAALQTVVGLLSVRVLRGRGLVWYYAPLEIVRTYVSLLCWIRACVSRRISWRGHAFYLQSGSVIVPVDRNDLAHRA